MHQQDPDDDTSMYHIFERLNTGGTFLRNQEFRNCIYHGRLSALPNELNKLESWRKILGRNGPDPQKNDIELILLFFAMRNMGTDKYIKPMKDYLNRFMKRNMNPGEGILAGFEDVFKETCSTIVAKLGERPFHVRRGLNVAVFDSAMVAFSNNIGRVPPDVRDRYKRLKVDEKFVESTTNSTTDADVVVRRFRETELQLFNS